MTEPVHLDTMHQTYLDYLTVRRMIALFEGRLNGPVIGMPETSPGMNNARVDGVLQMPDADANNMKVECSVAARRGGENVRGSDGPVGGGADGYSGLPFRGNFNGFPPHPNFPLGAGSGFGKFRLTGPVDFIQSHLRLARNEPYSVPSTRERYSRLPHDQNTPGYAANLFPSAMVNAAIRNAVNLSISTSNAGNFSTNSLTSKKSVCTNPQLTVGANATVQTPLEINAVLHENVNNPCDLRTKTPGNRSDIVPIVNVTPDLTRGAATSTDVGDTDSALTEATGNASANTCTDYREEDNRSTRCAYALNGSNAPAANSHVNGTEVLQNTGTTTTFASEVSALPDIIRFVNSSSECNKNNATETTNLMGDMALGTSGGVCNMVNPTATTNMIGASSSTTPGGPNLQSRSVTGNQQHSFQQQNSRLCRCVLCGYVTSDMNILMDHIDSHFPVRTYFCIQCTGLFSGQQELQEHNCPFKHS
ncbi:uncharacterized protein [Palaemon carinicauda]|uniref:uncharacterized protein isoform X2 n=1 Tax=Palaemon carinicauda TaxID=392227 RepID=UPI0035B5BE32